MGNMKIHYLTHTGESPFVCDICSKAFKTNGNLQDHKRRHLKEKPWKCTKCPKTYYRGYLLKSHIQKKHTQQFISNLAAKDHHLIDNNISQYNIFDAMIFGDSEPKLV